MEDRGSGGGAPGRHAGFEPPARAVPAASPDRDEPKPPPGEASAAAPAYVPPARAAGRSGPQAGTPIPQPGADNGNAITGFTLSLVAAGLLLLSVGLSSLISVTCAGLGIHQSLKGRRRIERGETSRHAGLARAGHIVGIVTLVLALLATIMWVVVGVNYATDPSFREELEDEIRRRGRSGTVLWAGSAVLRGACALLA